MSCPAGSGHRSASPLDGGKRRSHLMRVQGGTEGIRVYPSTHRPCVGRGAYFAGGPSARASNANVSTQAVIAQPRHLTANLLQGGCGRRPPTGSRVSSLLACPSLWRKQSPAPLRPSRASCTKTRTPGLLDRTLAVDHAGLIASASNQTLTFSHCYFY